MKKSRFGEKMLIESFLNQFQLDWAQAPCREKSLDFSNLSGKKIVISGESSVANVLAVSFLSANDLKDLGNEVFLLVGEDFSAEKPKWLSCRKDIRMINSLKEIPACDILIVSDFCLCNAQNSDDFKSWVSKANTLIDEIGQIKPEYMVLLSNNLVYGNLSKNYVCSEHEYGNSDYSEKSLSALLMQSVENLFFSASHQYGFSIGVIRCSNIVYGFSTDNFVNTLIKSIADGKLHLSGNKRCVSYISINDFINAVFYVSAHKINGGIYNACSDNSNISNAELCAIVNELFDDCSVTVDSDGLQPTGCAVNNTRLKKLGWTSSVCFKDALLIAYYAYKNTDEVFMFSDSYDGKLSVIQEILMGFLLEIDRICKKYDIKYFLGGGTLLGAIRHHGFIPWDDDADVMMLREDYDRFLEVLPKELPSFLFDQNTEKSSHFPFTKIRINNTVFSTEFTSNFSDVHNGVFLDILAQDKTSNNRLLRKLHIKLTTSLRTLVLNKWRGSKIDANSGFASAFANILKKLLPLKFLEKMQNHLISKYKNKKNADYLFDSMGRNIYNGSFPAKWLDEVLWVDFYDTKMPVPKEYDKYLTYLYGDYMKPVPVSKRHVSHEIIEIDLGEYFHYSYTCKSNKKEEK